MSETFGDKPDESAAGDNWMVAQGLDGDKRVIFRLLGRRPVSVDTEQYRHLISISWPYEPENEAGLPSPEQADRMTLLEARLVPALETSRAAFLAIVATGNGLRQWHWYCRDPDETMTLVNQALADCEPFPVEFSLDDDPQWEAHAQLRGSIGS